MREVIFGSVQTVAEVMHSADSSIEERFSWLESVVSKAHNYKCDVLVFPEFMFLHGYSNQELFKLAQSIDGPQIKQLQLIANVSPNPFTPRAGQYNIVHFTFNNENNEYVELKIWDITGRLVRTINGYGTSSISWDGKDENGEYVEGGVYIYQIKVGNDKVKRGTIVVAY